MLAVSCLFLCFFLNPWFIPWCCDLQVMALPSRNAWHIVEIESSVSAESALNGSTSLLRNLFSIFFFLLGWEFSSIQGNPLDSKHL